MFVVLEGFDKSGKTAVRNAFGKLNQWEQVIMDRGPVGNIFYDEIAGRTSKKRNAQYLQDLKKFTHACEYCVVFLYADEKDIIKRHKEVKEELPFSSTLPTTKYNKIQKRYFKLCKEYDKDNGNKGRTRVLSINTSELNLEQTMEAIGKFVDEVQSWN